MLQSVREAFLPRLNAFGSYELYDDTFLELTQKDVVGAQLLWNVFDGYKSIGRKWKKQ
jgi:outer membrane protein TolC